MESADLRSALWRSHHRSLKFRVRAFTEHLVRSCVITLPLHRLVWALLLVASFISMVASQDLSV